jgi:hypothetical protein
VPHVLVERVKYYDSAVNGWPTNADGGGATLQRVKPEEYGNDPINWVAAVPSPGRQLLQIDVAKPDAQDRLVLGFNGVAGSSYTVQYKDSLASPAWIKMADLAAQTNTGPRQVTDPTLHANPSRYYRVVSPIQP